MFASVLVLAFVASACADDTPYVKFLNGLLNALEPTVGANVSTCIAESDGSLVELRKGFALIESGIQTRNVSQVLEGGQYLKEGLLSIRDAAIKCNVPQIAEEFHQLFLLIATDPVAVFERVLPHFNEVVEDIESAVSAWRSGDFYAAGYDIGKVLVFLTNSSKPTLAFGLVKDTPPFVQFLEGLLSVLAPQSNGTVSPCITDWEDGFKQTKYAITLLEDALRHHNVSEIIIAGRSLKAALLELENAATACNATGLSKEIAQLINLLKHDPVKVANRILAHVHDVFADISDAVHAFRTNQYRTAGVDIGKVFVIILAHKPKSL